MIDLSAEEISMLRDAIESHVYWQLCAAEYRRDGHPQEPYSDEQEVRDDIGRFLVLDQKLDDTQGGMR